MEKKLFLPGGFCITPSIMSFSLQFRLGVLFMVGIALSIHALSEVENKLLQSLQYLTTKSQNNMFPSLNLSMYEFLRSSLPENRRMVSNIGLEHSGAQIDLELLITRLITDGFKLQSTRVRFKRSRSHSPNLAKHFVYSYPNSYNHYFDYDSSDTYVSVPLYDYGFAYPILVKFLTAVAIGTYGLLGLLVFHTIASVLVNRSGPPGKKGDMGSKGMEGILGDDGSMGDNGMNGNMGMKGIKGMKGMSGIHGDLGDIGAKGEHGPKGPVGITGLKGVKGVKGKNGFQGPKGSSGVKGPTGVAGEKGMKGAKGVKGSKGEKGNEGMTGNKGMTGDKGMIGNKGISGVKGMTGDKGASGYNGTKVNRGPRGNNARTRNKVANKENEIKGNKGATEDNEIKGNKGTTEDNKMKGNKSSSEDNGMKGSINVPREEGMKGSVDEEGIKGGVEDKPRINTPKKRMAEIKGRLNDGKYNKDQFISNTVKFQTENEDSSEKSKLITNKWYFPYRPKRTAKLEDVNFPTNLDAPRLLKHLYKQQQTGRRHDSHGNIFDAINNLWKQYENPRGCAWCLLYEFLCKQDTSSLDKYIV
ncbi:Collagen triple helix repeat [Trinorchestia longiramus]|nr:Collagen triple helix repeat [Trinorchestia longiramus]